MSVFTCANVWHIDNQQTESNAKSHEALDDGYYTSRSQQKYMEQSKNENERRMKIRSGVKLELYRS